MKFYRLEITERSEIEFTLDSEFAGLEIAILDSNGYVITAGETASKVKMNVSAAATTLYVRVRDKTKAGWDALNRNRAVKAFKVFSGVRDAAKNLINLVKGIPHITLEAGGVGVSFDLRNHLNLPDGRRIVSDVTATIPGVQASIQGTTVRLASGKAAHGGVRFVLRLCIPIADYCFTEVFSGTIGTRGPRLKPEYEGGVIRVPDMTPGDTFTSLHYDEYFEYPEGSRLTHSLGTPVRFSTDERWAYRYIEMDGKVVVSSASDMEPGDFIQVVWTVSDQHENRVALRFTIILEEPTPPPPPLPYACSELPLCTEFPGDPRNPSGSCPPSQQLLSQCPRTGALIITSCRYSEDRDGTGPRTQEQYFYFSAFSGSNPAGPLYLRGLREDCEDKGGTFTIHKR